MRAITIMIPFGPLRKEIARARPFRAGVPVFITADSVSMFGARVVGVQRFALARVRFVPPVRSYARGLCNECLLR